MTDIAEMYDRVKDAVEEIDDAVYISASDGSNSGLTIGGNKSLTQVIEVEFHGPVDEEYESEFLQLGNHSDWEFVDEDDVFNGDNSRGALISFSRDVDPEEVPAFDEFNKSEDL